jgi:hypothetical protein
MAVAACAERAQRDNVVVDDDSCTRARAFEAASLTGGGRRRSTGPRGDRMSRKAVKIRAGGDSVDEVGMVLGQT